MMTNKSLVRPRSSLSTDDNRLKPPLSIGRKKPSLTLLSLIGTCVFLLVLCMCLVYALVVVGRKFAYQKSSTKDAVKFASKQQTENHRVAKAVNYDSTLAIDDPLVLEENALLASERYWMLVNRNQDLYHPRLVFSLSGTEKARDSEVKKWLSAKSAVTKGSSTADGIMSKIIPKLSFRLPKEIRPRRYELYLHPDLENKRFTGKVAIDVDVLKTTSFIPLHSKKLNITSTHVHRIQKDGGGSVPVEILQSFEYEPHEYWVTEFTKNLEAGLYRLKLSFEGSLADRIVGFYESSYIDKKSNQTRWIATSKFEPTYARQAFPCFDEPAMKAKFRITVVYPKEGGYHALSNMNVEKIESVSETLTSAVFAESVAMSTYLACFIVSDFVERTLTIDAGGIGDNFDMRVYATPEQIDKVDFALETGAKITEFYIRYFGIPYPLPKLDMAAIPDFVSGAMEHWGLVTFRETALLYHEDISSSINKQRIGSVVSHELAHMWFGNLVTMKWWNDLWLNEGFASYIQYKGLSHAQPEWKLVDQFLIADLHGVLRLDATLASHPIVQTVESPDQITELFDTITYQKGASIIRMLEDFVGTKLFQDAVQQYLKKFSFSNAVTEDLLNEIAALTTEIDVKLILQTWTMQMGYPVVNVEKISGNQYRLTQKRFLSNPADENLEFNDSPFNYRWHIPITYITSTTSDVQRAWFSNSDTEITITVEEPFDWIKFNHDQIGYYRVNYAPAVWKELSAVLKADIHSMSIADRAHLLNDAYHLADATHLNYDIAFDLMDYLANEDEYVPWSVAASKLISLKNNLYHASFYQRFLAFGQELMKEIYTQVGWEPDTDHTKNRLRIVVLESACSLQYKPCLDEATRRFNEWLADPTKPPKPDIRTIVYTYGIASVKDDTTWDKVWNIFKDETDATEKIKLMSALAAIEVPSILMKYIELAWDTDNIRSQDYFTCLETIAANRVGESLVWDYVRGNWDKLVERFGLNERYLGRMIPSITGRFSSNIKLKEVQHFFEMNPEAGAGAASRRQAIENIRNNIEWLEGNMKDIGDWLEKRL